MKAEELLLTVAQAKRAELNADVALAADVDKNGPKYIAFGKKGAAAHERPIAVVLQGQNKAVDFIATTLPPDETEIGMAWKFGVKKIYFSTDAGLKQIEITNDGNSFQPKPLTMRADNYKVWKGTPDAAFPSPLNDTTAKAWRLAIERSAALETAGVRTKDAMTKTVYNSRVAVRGVFMTDLGLMPPINKANPAFADMVFTHLALALVSIGWRKSEKDADGGFNIGSILVDNSQKIIAWGLNLISENKSFHAETLMLQAYLKHKNVEELPENCVMYTSLESCHMCAGFAASVGNGLRVVYAQKDDQIVNSALERKVNGSSQTPPKIYFHPKGVPARLADAINSGAKPKLESGPATAMLARLKKEFQELDKFTGVTKFLFSDLGQYFYDIEQKVPGVVSQRLTEVAKAPVIPGRPPLPPQNPLVSHLDLAMPKAPLTPQQPRSVVSTLDLAIHGASPTPEARDLKNKQLFGAELALAEYALKFLDTLRKRGALTA
jgi:tRNA(Arg) A34 adenosine deaminase TadA